MTGIPTAAGTVRTPQRDRPRRGQVFEHFQGDAEAEWHRVELCGTDRVWFFRTADPARQAVPLAADGQITDPTILRQLERQA